ncbi:MAG: response regulator [Pseudomonadales bacterium]|nr:response regulator [Pseudomonadales bacterium]
MGDKKRILIVDDESINIELLTIYLDEQYDIVGAMSGEEALDIASAEPRPNLILLDITMNGMDGYETCSRLKSNPDTQHIPVVFLTALDHKEEEATGLQAGAVDYISKPIYPETVKARVSIQLALEEAQSQLRKAKRIVAAQKAEIDRLNDVKSKLIEMVRSRNARIEQLTDQAAQ